MDFSSMLTAIDFTTCVAAIIGAGAAMALPGIAKYGVRSVLGLFGR